MKLKNLIALASSFVFGLSIANRQVQIANAEQTYPTIGQECVVNGSFSQDLKTFEAVEDFTNDNFVNLLCTHTVASDECRSQGGAVKIQYDSQDGHLNTSDFPAIWQDVYVKQNTYYLWSAYVRRGGDAPNGWFSIGYRNPLADDKWVAVNQNLFNDTTNEWQQISIVIYTAELTAIRASMHVQCCSTGHDGFYFIDDASLIEVDINDLIDTSSNAKTDVQIADFSTQYVNDPGFENAGSVGTASPFGNFISWKSFSWAGTDRNYWGNEGSKSNAFLTYSNDGLPAGEKPTIGIDLNLEKHTYYVVSLFAKKWSLDDSNAYLEVAFQDSNAVDSGGDNNTALDRKNQDFVKFYDFGTEYREYFGILYTGEYSKNRLVVFTEGLEYDGSLVNGFHVDDVRLWKALTPKASKMNISAGFKIGEPITSNITVNFEGKTDYVSVPFSQHVRTHYSFSEEGVFASDLANNLVALNEGSATVSCELEIMGKKLSTNSIRVVVSSSNINTNKYIKEVDVELNQATSTTEYRTLDISTFDCDYQYLNENDINLSVVAEDPKVAYIRLLTTGYHVLGISKGTTTIYVTAFKNNSLGIGKIEISVDTDNLLVDSSFEAQNEWGFWKYYGNSGGSVDDGQTNIFRHSGYANIWMMSPIWWNGDAPIDAESTISQIVDVPIGKYDLSVYINRFHATGSEGELSAFGGMAQLRITPVDENGNATGQSISREFDTSYGSYAYGKLSLVFDVTNAGLYEVALIVKGDSEFGLGMQIDDFTLKPAIYPTHIEASLGEDVVTVDIESIYNIYVYAFYEDGSVVQLTTDIRFFFDDFSIACYSNGFLFPRRPGTTTCTVVASILDKTYTASFDIVVSGEIKKDDKEKKGCQGSITGSLTLLIISSLTLIGASSFKRREK